MGHVSTIGHHVLVELYGCRRDRIDDPDVVRAVLRGAASAIGSEPLGEAFHRFSPQGVSGVLLIAESHLSCHTWPERGYVAVDIYTCAKVDPAPAAEHLRTALEAKSWLVHDVVRGLVDHAPPLPRRTTQALFDPLAFHSPVGWSHDAIAARAQVLVTNGVVDVTTIVPDAAFDRAREEALRVLGAREDAHGGDVFEHSAFIRTLYESGELLERLTAITGAALAPCPAVDARVVIAKQDRPRQSGAWSWGAFSYGLTWVLEAPRIEQGGMLQCVPDAARDELEGRVHEALIGRRIDTYDFRAGQSYLVRADRTMQRIMPLEAGARRIVMTMSWTTRDTS